GYDCRPTGVDNPEVYAVDEGLSKYNCKPINSSQDPSLKRQPSDFCYGPHANPNTYKTFGEAMIKIVTGLGADGIDLDIEDTNILASTSEDPNSNETNYLSK